MESHAHKWPTRAIVSIGGSRGNNVIKSISGCAFCALSGSTSAQRKRKIFTSFYETVGFKESRLSSGLSEHSLSLKSTCLHKEKSLLFHIFIGLIKLLSRNRRKVRTASFCHSMSGAAEVMSGGFGCRSGIFPL